MSAGGVVQVLFTRRHHLGSVAIRAATWSPWSHVDVILPGGRIIGATLESGVAVHSLESRILKASRAAVTDFPSRNPDAIYSALYSQISKKYDWTAILGMVLRNRNWQEDDSWFCSELIAWAFQEAGEPLFRENMVDRITPHHLWMLSNPAVVYKNPELVLNRFK